MDLKAEVIRLLKEDEEFRYMVAGLLGLEEILRRLDRHEEILTKLMKDFSRMIGEQVSLREDFNRMNQEIRSLREDFNRMNQEIRSLREDFVGLRKDFIDLRGDMAGLRRDFNKMYEDMRRLRVTVDRLCVSEEEEAREVISDRLGGVVRLGRLQLPHMEINIYGATAETCVVGEATVRLGVNLVEKLEGKVRDLQRLYPEYLRDKTVKVIYTLVATPQALELARKRGIWVLTWREDLTPRPEI